jgi:hypothetical protein
VCFLWKSVEPHKDERLDTSVAEPNHLFCDLTSIGLKPIHLVIHPSRRGPAITEHNVWPNDLGECLNLLPAIGEEVQHSLQVRYVLGVCPTVQVSRIRLVDLGDWQHPKLGFGFEDAAHCVAQ